MTLQELTIGLLLGTFGGLMIYVGFALPIEASDIPSKIKTQNKNIKENTAGDLKATIQKVAEDFRREQGFDGQCYIAGEKVTLAQMLYGLGVAEGGFIEGSIGMRTNNPGSLHNGMGIKKVVRYHNADSTATRPEYETMYDGLYEKAYLIASPKKMYKCNFSLNSAFAYTSGPNAERTKARMQNAQNHLSHVLVGAKKYLGVKSETPPQKQANNGGKIYPVARQKQDEADKLWEACIMLGECQRSL